MITAVQYVPEPLFMGKSKANRVRRGLLITLNLKKNKLAKLWAVLYRRERAFSSLVKQVYTMMAGFYSSTNMFTVTSKHGAFSRAMFALSYRGGVGKNVYSDIKAWNSLSSNVCLVLRGSARTSARRLGDDANIVNLRLALQTIQPVQAGKSVPRHELRGGPCRPPTEDLIDPDLADL